MQDDVASPEGSRVEREVRLGARARWVLSQAADDVIAERVRQASAEGWTPEHDDEHIDRSLATAAVCYVQHYIGRTWVRGASDGAARYRDSMPPSRWPATWDDGWWKPKDPRRDLVRAAALLIAEIERLDRGGKA